jgi:hypothetical protein
MANLPVGWASREFIHSLDGQRVDMTAHQERGNHHYLDGQKTGWPTRDHVGHGGRNPGLLVTLRWLGAKVLVGWIIMVTHVGAGWFVG